ncbi:nose resistant to fluoxetine protein 6-like [Cydia splendana]|uniref:nose resistant to fluoxetine protein 6-like n=1 Tax=Cydia splendana TaxID=1100963 RepID=UPI00300D7751
MKSLFLLFLVHQSSAVIHYLNLTEYSKMPDLYQMDDYDTCVMESGGTYCLVDADLYSKEHSNLMLMIQEYSKNTRKHYNHTKVHRALCVRKSCKDFVKNRSLENESDLRSILEECVDESVWKGYKLNARLTEVLYCKRHGDKRSFSTGDYTMAGVYLVLIILNAVGTSYDFINGDAAGNPYLLAFSVRRNWRKLIAPSGVGPEPRLNRLKIINGLRSLTMVCVFFSHSVLVLIVFYLKNPYFVENMFNDPTKYILLNGTLVTYTFFVMSGFLLAFNFELHAEKHRVSLWEWPKGMVLRWLRLTPTYALIMFTVMTLMRHLGDGPQWELVVTSESDACHKHWWAHLLYIHNYLREDMPCFPQSWYLSADTQLFGLGLLVCIVCRKPRTQMLMLGFLMAVSVAIPAAHTYFQNLSAVVHNSPESLRTYFRYNREFQIIFVRGHTNLSTYVLGIAGGLLAYHWLNNEKAVSERLQKYAWLIWLVLPIAVSVILSGGIFYMDDFEPSTFVRVLYASVHKPIFQLCIVVLIISAIFKIKSMVRYLLEWRGFTWTSRVAYAGFLVHSMFQRGLVGAARLPAYMTDYNVITILAATVFLSFGTGALLYVAVESPVAALLKAALEPRRVRAKEQPAVDAPTDVTTKS